MLGLSEKMSTWTRSSFLVCYRSPDVEDAPLFNPRPNWAWPRKEGAVMRLCTDVLGFKYETPLWCVLEIDRLSLQGSPALGTSVHERVGLGSAELHADVLKLHGERIAVLEMQYRSTSGTRRSLALKFESLDVMHEWWCALEETRQLLKRVAVEDGGETYYEDDEDDEDDGSPRSARNERHTDLTRGLFEPSVVLAMRQTYEQVLGMLIRPPRATYTMDKLGPTKFAYGRVRGSKEGEWQRARPFVRDDFTVTNGRGLRVVGSLWRPAGEDEMTASVLGARYVGSFSGAKLMLAETPTLIYLHGNSSCRLEAMTALSLCLGLGVAVCAIDCAGSGHSDGEYVSLGHYESDDVVSVVQFLKTEYGMRKYGLWGRSMGSATALLYASGKAPDCACLVADSPFASIKQLCYDLVHKATTKVPDGAVALAVRKIRSSVRYRTKFDIYECAPVQRVASLAAPTLIVHGRDDDFISPSHTDSIAARYKGRCLEVLKPPGNHNARRPYGVYVKIEAFLALHLLGDPDAPRRVDFSRVTGLPRAVQNPYLLPPWAFATSAEGECETRLQLPGFTCAQPRPSPSVKPDEEFVSGMSDQRQKEVEAGVGNIFRASAKPHSARR